MGDNRHPLTPGVVAEAAEVCLRRRGVRATSMVDIARELGVTRQTVHRLFGSKTAILKYVANRRILALGAQLKLAFERFDMLEDALVEGSVDSVQAGLGDLLLADMIEHSDDHGFEQFVFSGTPEIEQIMIEIWSPLLAGARARGVLREGISDELAVEWIRNVHAMAVTRSEYDVERQRLIYATFLVPSLCDRTVEFPPRCEPRAEPS